ncbi:MAG: gliding motility-associated ABC transporter permease subunit GldF [Flavobacteriaceae bacterium]
MFAIFKREIQSFFTSPIGYMVVVLFLVLNGLFLWVFKGAFNIFDYGFADLGNFFFLAPWMFLLLIPAITMRSFSEEKKLGTLELLFIKPIGIWPTVMGKFLGTFTLAFIALLPTLLYVYTLVQLGTTIGNLDLGQVMGSYFGLLFLIGSYIAMGLFASTLSDNQIVAFILGIAICFSAYYGFEALSTLFADGDSAAFMASLGMKSRAEALARGVLDSRDLIYFVSLTVFFLFCTVLQLKYTDR